MVLPAVARMGSAAYKAWKAAKRASAASRNKGAAARVSGRKTVADKTVEIPKKQQTKGPLTKPQKVRGGPKSKADQVRDKYAKDWKPTKPKASAKPAPKPKSKSKKGKKKKK